MDSLAFETIPPLCLEFSLFTKIINISDTVLLMVYNQQVKA